MRAIKIFLIPLSWLFLLVTRIRNHLYDSGTWKSFEFENTLINVGNLAVGGTGKTPMIEYLIRLLKDDFSVATLSRGYRRKTSGFRVAGPEDNSLTIGDEPYQIRREFGEEVLVAVGEDRAMAIPEILSRRPENEIILLDDAFQHRSIKADFNLVLTRFKKPFYRDYLLPYGRLRESRSGARRADSIIVTKCPEGLTERQMETMLGEMKLWIRPETPVFFARTSYGEPQPLFDDQPPFYSSDLIVLTGIAHPDDLIQFLKNTFNVIHHARYPDHHWFTLDDLKKVQLKAKKSESSPVVITTQKDMVRLIDPSLRDLVKELPLYFIPIEHRFLKDGRKFEEMIAGVIKSGINSN